MIRINLLPARATDQVSSRRKELVLVGGAFVIILLSILSAQVLQSAKLANVSRNLDHIERELATIRKENQDLEKMERQRKDLEEKIRVVNLLTSPQRRAASVHVLDDLSSSTPQFLWLTEYAEIKGIAQIRGKAIDNQTIAAFAHNLTSSPYFRNVEIRETQQEAQSVTSRGKTGKVAAKEANTPSVMMTKFLIEAVINYGLPIETASSEETDEKSQDKKGVAKKPPAKAAAAASATSKE